LSHWNRLMAMVIKPARNRPAWLQQHDPTHQAEGCDGRSGRNLSRCPALRGGDGW
jgi:hypothetical protein